MAHPDHDPDVGDVQVVPWTAELALRLARHPGAPVNDPAAVEAVRDAVDDDRMPEPAVEALIAAGWTDLA